MNDMTNWLALDLNDRRYIVVTSSSTTQEAIPGTTADGLGGLGAALDRVPLPVLAAGAFVPLFTLPALVGMAARALKQGAAEGGPPASFLRVPSDFVGGIDFGPSGWEPDVVYAVNPKLATMYRPLATFHEELLLHKLTELDRLLNALGAKEYEISHVRRRAGEGAGGVDVGSLVGVGSGARRSALCERRWSGTSDGHAPRLPEDLCWYPGEREWQNLAESRFHGFRRKFAFSVRQDEAFGVDAELATRFEAIPLKIGGRYASVEQVEFAVSGTF